MYFSTIEGDSHARLPPHFAHFFDQAPRGLDKRERITLTTPRARERGEKGKEGMEMSTARKMAALVRHGVAAALYATALSIGHVYAVVDGSSDKLPDHRLSSVAAQKICGCVAVGAGRPDAKRGLTPSPARSTVFTKILDSSSCGGFAGGTCFATDNSVCYLEITCNDNGCIMDCA